jgi:hypothetical protein
MAFIQQNSSGVPGTYWPTINGEPQTASKPNKLQQLSGAVQQPVAILPRTQQQYMDDITQLRAAAAGLKNLSSSSAAAPVALSGNAQAPALVARNGNAAGVPPTVRTWSDPHQQDIDDLAEEQGWYTPLNADQMFKLANDPALQAQLRHSQAPSVTFSRLTGHSFQQGQDRVTVTQQGTDKDGSTTYQVQIGQHTVSVHVPEHMDGDRVVQQVIKSYQSLPAAQKGQIHDVIYHAYPDTAKTHPPAGRGAGVIDLYYSEGNGLNDYSQRDFQQSAAHAADHSWFAWPGNG